MALAGKAWKPPSKATVDKVDKGRMTIENKDSGTNITWYLI
jgi:hypothetical protein